MSISGIKSIRVCGQDLIDIEGRTLRRRLKEIGTLGTSRTIKSNQE